MKPVAYVSFADLEEGNFFFDESEDWKDHFEEALETLAKRDSVGLEIDDQPSMFSKHTRTNWDGSVLEAYELGEQWSDSIWDEAMQMAWDAENAEAGA